MTRPTRRQSAAEKISPVRIICKSDAFADQASQPLRATIAGNQAELDFRLTHFCVLTGDAEGAGEREFAAAAESKTVDAGDDGFAAGFNGAQDSLSAQGEIAAFDTVDLGKFLNVGAGGKGFFAGTGEDGHANGIVRLDGVDDGLQFAQGSSVERVQNFRPVESEECNAVADFELYIFQCFFWRHICRGPFRSSLQRAMIGRLVYLYTCAENK